MSGPVIGITSGLLGDWWGPQGMSWLPYAEAVRRAGGVPLHVSSNVLEQRPLPAPFAGLLVAGGRDIGLAHASSEPLELTAAADVEARFRMKTEPKRDLYEIPLLRAALGRNIPVLGICRGCQLLHVVHGGALILDIESDMGKGVEHGSESAEASNVHDVNIAQGSLLRSLLPDSFVRCNSRHHQAIRVSAAARGRISAWAPDGVPEAIEFSEYGWVIGVQWHPERAKDEEQYRASEPLFEAFVAAARGR